VVSSPNMIGIWNMSIIKEDNEDNLASLNFLVLLSNDEELLNVRYLPIIIKFWSISDICSRRLNSSSCRDLSNQTSINDCLQQRWSFFFYDIKSDW
jgi:hypothetical protein